MATALLVLDMLTDFTSGRLANPAAGQITEPIAALARAARERDDWLVVYGNDALSYLHTYYGAEVTSTSALL
jgi:nicotinamidase-related amidase